MCRPDDAPPYIYPPSAPDDTPLRRGKDGFLYTPYEDGGQFVQPSKARQHLNRDGTRTTLCGHWFEHLDAPKVYDHRDGFDPKGGPMCAPCADAADAIQNGDR